MLEMKWRWNESDRLICVKVEIERYMLNVVSGYAPHVDCELEEKKKSRNELDGVIDTIPGGESSVGSRL